jgi:hypothetical protein
MARTVVRDCGPAKDEGLSLFTPPTRALRSSSVIDPRLTVTAVISGKEAWIFAGRTSWKKDLSGHPGMVRARSTVTCGGATSMPLTMPSSTMLR